MARWAGLLLGIAVFVRVDNLLVLPLIFLAHAATNVLREPGHRATSVWIAFYQTALPGFVLGSAYYRFFSTPYYEDHYLFIRPMYLITATCLLALLATATPLSRLLRPLVRSRPTLLALSVAVLGAAAYAYFVRPYAEPFQTFVLRGTPVPGMRSRNEDTLVNLAAYLSPTVVCAAIAGWLLSLWAVLRREERPYVLPVLVLGGCLSVVYLYDQAIYPDHYWAIRRFVPVVIPAFVLFAAVGVSWLFARVSRRFALAAGALAAAYLAVVTLNAGSLSFCFRENAGSYAQLQRLASHLPRDEVVLAYRSHVSHHWLTPLYLSFDRRVVPLDPKTMKGRAAVRQWLREQERKRQPAYVLTDRRVRLAGVSVRPLYSIELSRRFTERPEVPLPHAIETFRRRLTLYELTRAGGDQIGVGASDLRTGDRRPRPGERR